MSRRRTPRGWTCTGSWRAGTATGAVGARTSPSAAESAALARRWRRRPRSTEAPGGGRAGPAARARPIRPDDAQPRRQCARRRRRWSRTAAWSVTATALRAPGGDARRRRPRTRRSRRRWTASKPRSRSRRRRPRPTRPAPRAARPPASAALERSGRIVVLEPDLAYAATTYRTIEATAPGAGRRRAAHPGRVPRRDRDQPQVRHGDPRRPRSARDPAANPGRPRPGATGAPWRPVVGG